MPFLVPHNETRSAGVSIIGLSFMRDGCLLLLRYIAEGGAETVKAAPEDAPDRTNDLWKTTCFECFIEKPGGGYFEFNFAPSRRWAAYAFDAYRAGMRDLEIPTPRIKASRMSGDFVLDVGLDLSGVAALADAPDWTMAVSAVIEENSGAKSYWALKHPPGKPDFHHPDGFDLILSAEG